MSRLAAPYLPRRPQETVLYDLVKDHLDEFLQHAQPGHQCRPNVGAGNCYFVPAKAVDEAVTRIFLDTVKPPELELALAVVRVEIEALQHDGRLARSLAVERVESTCEHDLERAAL